MEGHRIKGLGFPSDFSDAVTLQYVTTRVQALADTIGVLWDTLLPGDTIPHPPDTSPGGIMLEDERQS